MNTPPAREEDLFHRALALPAADRTAFLERQCAADAALRTAVELLLKVHDAAKSYLPSAAPGLAETVAQFAPRAEEKAGDAIGRYKLLQQIGEGGCGVVYMAEQEVPVRRRVALKVIKLGMDTKAVIARFEAERQALAMMDHPNIAKVLDAGTTETGRPFFVMELVRGVPITKYCDEASLSTGARLELFTLVCHAIQHAHQKGIIHRDVKPSNILVTLHDGVAVPKVIDFGIAKATLGRLTDQTLFTAFEQFIGTPAYMSPEQAEMSGLDIDTRSDIYSLGVLLYELLTGRPPFDPKTFLEAGLDELRRIIREVEPPRPSTRLGTLNAADQSTVAKLRGTVTSQLSSLLSGDLDWIVMKALEKNRVRRYETASAFAADVQRHLHNEPVVARPPSTAYLLQKLVHRHKLAFAAGSAIAAALVLGLGFSTWSFIQEKAARQRAVAAEQEQSRQRELADAARANEARQRVAAEANEKKAKSEALKSEQAFKFMGRMLSGVGPSVAAGRDTTLLREILDKTVKRLDRDMKDQPEIGANIRKTLAGVYLDLGDYARGETLAREAVAQSEKINGRQGEDVAGGLAVLAMARLVQGQPGESETLIREVLAMLRQLPGDQNDKIGPSLFLLGTAQIARLNLTEAEATLREALAIARARDDLEELPPDAVLTLLASVLQKQGRLGEAEPMIREALALQKARLANDNPLIGYSMAMLSNVLLMQGKLAEAGTLFAEALVLLKKSLGPEHPNIAAILPNIGMIAMRQGKWAEAEATLNEALALQTKVMGNDHPAVANSRSLLAEVLHRQGKSGDAAAQQDKAQAATRKGLGSDEMAAADAKANLAVSAMRQGKWAEAEAALREVIPVVERVNGIGHQITLSCKLMLANAVFEQIRPAESEAILREVVAESRKAFGNKSTLVASALLTLGRSLNAQDKLADTETALREALAISRTQTTDSVNAPVAESLLLLAAIRARLGDAAEASKFAREAAAVSGKLAENQRNNALGPMDVMATKLRQQGKPAEAVAVERTAMEFVVARDGRTGNVLGQQAVRLAQALKLTGEYAEAEALAREGWELRKKFRPATDWTVPNAQSILGEIQLAAKKYPEAEATLLAAFADLEKNQPKTPDSVVASWRSRMRIVATALAELFAATGRPENATEWRQKATAFNAAVAAGTNPGEPNLAALTAQDNLLRQQGKYAEAEAIERQMIEFVLAREGTASPAAATNRHKLAGTLNQQAKFAEAEPFARDALASREKNLAAGNWNIASTRSSLGVSLLGQKKFSEAEPVLLRAYAELQAAESAIPPANKARITETATFLSLLYEQTAQPEKAAEWKRKAAGSLNP